MMASASVLSRNPPIKLDVLMYAVAHANAGPRCSGFSVLGSSKRKYAYEPT